MHVIYWGMGESTAQPLPVSDIACRFMINEQLFKHLGSSLPADVATTSGQEARYRMASQMMNPAFGTELVHDCVYPRKSGLAVCPALEP